MYEIIKIFQSLERPTEQQTDIAIPRVTLLAWKNYRNGWKMNATNDTKAVRLLHYVCFFDTDIKIIPDLLQHCSYKGGVYVFMFE